MLQIYKYNINFNILSMHVCSDRWGRTQEGGGGGGGRGGVVRGFSETPKLPKNERLKELQKKKGAY